MRNQNAEVVRLIGEKEVKCDEQRRICPPGGKHPGQTI